MFNQFQARTVCYTQHVELCSQQSGLKECLIEREDKAPTTNASLIGQSHKYNSLCYVALREVGDHAEGELMLMAILVGVELVQPAEYSLYRPLVSADSTYI